MSKTELKAVMREMEIKYFETGDDVYLDEYNELKQELEAM